MEEEDEIAQELAYYSQMCGGHILDREWVARRVVQARKAGAQILWVGLRVADNTILATPDKATALDYVSGDARLARRWLCLAQEDGSVRLLCKARDVVTARLGVPTPLPAVDPEPLASEDA